MLKEIEKRQSIRKYKDTAVEKEKITEILKAAMNAPTARNSQEWEFKVMQEAPCAILVIANLDKAKNVEYGLINCAAAIENMLIEAVNQGLGSCWCGIAPVEQRIKDFKNYYHLKENEYPVGVVALGYSNEDKPLIDRYDSKKVSYFE